jgi:hypothetical protein
MKIMVARDRGSEEQLQEVRISRSVMDEVLRNGKSVLTADAQHDPRFMSQTIALQGIRSVLAVPLSVDERDIFGLIYADSPTWKTTFTEKHLNILTTLASVASIRVENAALTDEKFQRERMERELELATEIQQRFQPSGPPQIEGYEFQGISFSCYEIGGDYYDFITTPNDRMLVALGDVSGKGTAAALLMSSLHAAIHAQVAANSQLHDTIISVNGYLAEITPANRFVALFTTGWTTPGPPLHQCRHNPPIIDAPTGPLNNCHLAAPSRHHGRAEWRSARPNSTKEVLVIYSDGVSEAVNLGRRNSVLNALPTLLKRILAPPPRHTDKVESALSTTLKPLPPIDGITVMVGEQRAPFQNLL